MATRDYSSIYTIKDFAINELAPKYFDMEEISQSNVGLLGYTTDLIANTTEDTFNTVTMLVKEIFPNLATIPESIYSYASMFQLENLFAKPAEMSVMLFLSEEDILKYGAYKETQIEFILDSLLKINVEGKEFMLDYDVKIVCREIRGEKIYSAIYNMDFNNSISDVINPFIKVKIVNYSNKKYVGLFVKVRQVNRFDELHNIITNDKINLPTINIPFGDQLAGFEVFYKKAGATTATQLIKKLANTPASKDAFCYYKFKNEQELEISFTSKDFYFKPEFNSEIMVRYYTTTGVSGNFSMYKGTNIVVVPKSETYAYNNGLILFAIVQSESILGQNTLTVNEIQPIVVEKFSTVDSYTTENDLALYFSSLNYNGAKLTFIKKRDDLFERLFGSFTMVKKTNGDIFHTNTLTAVLASDNYDLEYEQSDRWLMKPGHVFKYVTSDERTKVIQLPGSFIKDTDVATMELSDFIYTCPFLVSIGKKPATVGYYLNTVKESKLLDFKYVNMDMTVQTICNSIEIKRNAIMGENEYTLTLNLLPTGDITADDIIDKNTGLYTDVIRVMGVISDNGVDSCYTEFVFKEYNVTTGYIIFEAKLETDDYITLTQKMRVPNLLNLVSGDLETKTIPMNNCMMTFNTFYKKPGAASVTAYHAYAHLPKYADYALTNIYSVEGDLIDFIVPVSIMNSPMKFTPNTIEGNIQPFAMEIHSMPFVRASAMKTETDMYHFLDSIKYQYGSLLNISDKITNNYSIDLKFYNTYGRSKTFVVGESETLLDKVNVSIAFKVAPTVGADVEALLHDIKLTIKDYIETLNTESGANGIYVSKLIQILENNFPEIRYMKFDKINEYSADIQIVEAIPVSNTMYTMDQKRNFVPEHVTVLLEDINLSILNN